MKTNDLALTAEKLFVYCDDFKYSRNNVTIDLSEVLKFLPHITLDSDYVLEGRTPRNEGAAGITIMYVRRKSDLSPSDDYLRRSQKGNYRLYDGAVEARLNPLNHITVDRSPESLWECHLLSDIWRFFPLWYHATYCMQKYITDADNILSIIPVREHHIMDYQEKRPVECYDTDSSWKSGKEDIINAINLCGDSMLLPSVRLDGDGGEITYTYWSMWEGLVRIRKKAIISKEGRVSFPEEPKEIHLVGYNCGATI